MGRSEYGIPTMDRFRQGGIQGMQAGIQGGMQQAANGANNPYMPAFLGRIYTTLYNVHSRTDVVSTGIY